MKSGSQTGFIILKSICIYRKVHILGGGMVASWLVPSSPYRALPVSAQALAWDIVLCSWARHFTLTVSGSFNARGNPVLDQHPIERGVEILLVPS